MVRTLCSTKGAKMENNARTIFVTNLKYYMQLRKKEQVDIARDLKIPLSTVSNWYNGVSYPRVDSMQLLADYLNVGMRDLTDERKEDDEPKFKTAQEAVEYILRQPLVAAYGGYDLDQMTDQQIIDFANEIARMIQFMAKHFSE